MTLTGPAAGHPLLQTEADPTGTQVLGTINNCGAGRTPWGTYLTCEENFNGYFGSSDPEAAVPEGFDRYGIAVESGYAYELHDARFDFSRTPNEAHRHGYVVEIDPSDAASTPVKRTALGRFKHENAAVVLARDGRVVVYLGDDERGEFLYKYVSREAYAPGEGGGTLLDEGQLHVARFEPDGTGEWVALTPEATGMDQALIHIHTRQAASAVGATTMDRPEWVAVNPLAAEAYCCLTNNSRREPGAANAGGDAMVAVEGSPNPRDANEYGQIVRWYPADGDHADGSFTWDLYVMAGNPTVHEPGSPYAGSANVNEGNLFNSPDGMMFDAKGLVWIQTDGDDSNEGEFAGMGNNQMLVGDPATGEIRRFMTGPNGSEVTGMAFSADRRTVFAGIQHPGGSFPDGTGLPRSAIVAIRRDDGAIVA
jgi:secreted PhoX family phosphatase